MTARTPDHPIENLFVDRWSPRAFDRSTIEEADLKTILEAARWSPSAFNIQPWRFVYARRGDADWQVLVDLLNPFNRDWAQHASALVYLFSDSEVDGKDGKPNRANGLHTSMPVQPGRMRPCRQPRLVSCARHGRDPERRDPRKTRCARTLSAADCHCHWPAGDTADLPETLQERETPSSRKPLAEIAFAGAWA